MTRSEQELGTVKAKQGMGGGGVSLKAQAVFMESFGIGVQGAPPALLIFAFIFSLIHGPFWVLMEGKDFYPFKGRKLKYCYTGKNAI